MIGIVASEALEALNFDKLDQIKKIMNCETRAIFKNGRTIVLFLPKE